MKKKIEDVIIYDVYYCPDCGYEKAIGETYVKQIEARKCPKCGGYLFITTRVKKI